MTAVRWGVALLFAAFLVFMGVQKFMPGENAIFSTIAQRSGIALFEPVVRMLVGVAELLAAALLILPKTRALGAPIGFGVLGGAILFHLSPWLGINVPGMGPSLFYMAVVFILVGGVVVYFEKEGILALVAKFGLGGKAG